MAKSSYEVPVLDTYHAVVLAFSDFLTVAIHTILYERDIYPRTSFLSARKYNLPVKQSRHPKVCQWIQDAVAAVEVEMLKCTISSTSLIIHSPESEPLERYLFSTASFPRIPPSEHLTPFDLPSDPTNASEAPNSAAIPNAQADQPSTSSSKPPEIPPVPQEALTKRFNPPPTSDLPEQFRATLSRLSALSSTLAPLPPDCSFTLAIELRDEFGVDPPIGQPQPWIAAERGVQRERYQGKRIGDSNEKTGDEDGGKKEDTETRIGSKKGKDLGGVRTTPVRSLEAGAFIMEVWVEEGRGKFNGKDNKGDGKNVAS